MRTTRTHEEAANLRRDAKAHARRSAGEATRERLLTLTPLTERRLELAYALDRACSSGQKAAPRSLISRRGLRAIPQAEWARIAVPTTLIWVRHDRQVRLGVAQAASALHRWPLHVIEDAADDPAHEQPEEAFLRGLNAALVPAAAGSRRQP